MEEKNIKITINVECSEKSSVKKEQIAGYLLRAIAGVAANNKCLITNYVYLIALILLSWLSAMVGYDKVIQSLGQIKLPNKNE